MNMCIFVSLRPLWLAAAADPAANLMGSGWTRCVVKKTTSYSAPIPRNYQNGINMAPRDPYVFLEGHRNVSLRNAKNMNAK